MGMYCPLTKKKSATPNMGNWRKLAKGLANTGIQMEWQRGHPGKCEFCRNGEKFK